MTSPRLRAAVVAACLPGLPCCVSARSMIGPTDEATPFLVGPVRAIGAAPDRSPAVPPEGEPITVRAKGSEGAVMSMFGPRWQGGGGSSEHMNRLKLHPGAPVHVRHHGCHSFRIFAVAVYHVQVWCTIEADIAPAPGEAKGE